MGLKEIFPKMHGATSIWISSLILSLRWLNPAELLASIFVITAVGSGHRVIFVKKPEKIDYIILSITSLLILYTAIENKIILVYSIPFALSLFFRNDFRKYVIFSSVLTAIPSAYLPLMEYHILFVSFALAYVLVADSLIYDDRKTAILAFLIYVPISIYINPIFLAFSIALSIPLVKRFKTKTLGLYLLSTLIIFSLFELITIYHNY